MHVVKVSQTQKHFAWNLDKAGSQGIFKVITLKKPSFQELVFFVFCFPYPYKRKISEVTSFYCVMRALYLLQGRPSLKSHFTVYSVDFPVDFLIHLPSRAQFFS